jgi:hypothetical protein
VIAVSPTGLRSPVEGAGERARIVSLETVLAAGIVVYFSATILYYLRAFPLGHLLNLFFLVLFAFLAAAYPANRRVGATIGILVLSAIVLTVTSLISFVMRDQLELSELLRSLTWLTPAALALAVNNRLPLDHGRICYSIGVVNLFANVLITVILADFNTSIAKFEVAAPWLAISSNELSFHLIAFCFLFLALGRGMGNRVFARGVFLGSFIHLSKAHLVALAALVLTALLRKRIWLAIIVVLAGAVLLSWLATSQFIATINVPDSVERVFEPVLDAIDIIAALLFTGSSLDLDATAAAVGGHRFEVYQAALDLLLTSPFGNTQDVVETALRGLDPHSNLLYLALREGWLMALGYVLSLFVFIRSVPVASASRLVVACFVYVWLRSVFLTFDPVKILALATYVVVMLYCTPRSNGQRS